MNLPPIESYAPKPAVVTVYLTVLGLGLTGLARFSEELSLSSIGFKRV